MASPGEEQDVTAVIDLGHDIAELTPAVVALRRVFSVDRHRAHVSTSLVRQSDTTA